MSILNRYKIAVTVIGVMVLAVIALGVLNHNKSSADQNKDKETKPNYESKAPEPIDQIILKTDNATKNEIVTAEGGGITKKSDIPQLGMTVYTVDTTQNTTEEVLGRMQKKLQDKHPDKVKAKEMFAEQDMKVAPSLIPNDPYYSNQWHLPKINAPLAWDTANGSNVIIAIGDTGVDATHPDLVANMIPGWNSTGESTDTNDICGHGTPVAGAAAAIGNNATGGLGVAWNAKILPIRITEPTWSCSTSSSAAANAITYAADQGAKVINLSYGLVGITSVRIASKYMHDKGGLVIISGGNGGSLIDSTYTDPNEIIVSATDSTDTLASWSSFGDPIDVSAPGASIQILTANGGGYGSGSGTSFSAPLVSATLAIIWTANSTLTNSQVENILETTAKDLGTTGWDQKYGWGRIDAGAAVAKAIGTTSPPPTADTTAPTAPTNLVAKAASSTSINLTWSPSTDNVGVTGYQIYRNNAQVGTSNTTSYTDSGLIASTSYSYTVKATDAAGNISAASNTTTATTQSNTVTITSGPTVTSKTATTATISWTTSIASTGVINYGIVKTNLDQIFQDTSSVTTHTVTLTGLTRGKAYYYKITATGTDGSNATSAILSFRTKNK